MWKRGFGFFLVFFSATHLYAADRITAEVETKPSVKLNARESRALSLAAAQILIQVDRARSSISKNRLKNADRHLAQGLLLVRIINKSVPGYDVVTKIKAGDLTYIDQEDSKPTIIPIYEELQQVAVMAPIEAAKKEVQKESSKAGTPMTVDMQLVHTEADLNVDLAQAGLQAAQNALQRKDLKFADNALRTVQSGVIFTYFKMDLPLEKARENLIIAKNLVEEGKNKEARAALDLAGDALQDYEKGVGENRAKKAQELRDQIQNLAKNLNSKSKGVSDQIVMLWDQVRKLSQ